MKILVVGNGGREHALAWKLGLSSRADRVFVAPGNAGTATDAENVDIPATDVKGLLEFAKRNEIDLTVVGPEAALGAGLVDAFQKAGLRVFGPSKAASNSKPAKSSAKTCFATPTSPRPSTASSATRAVPRPISRIATTRRSSSKPMASPPAKASSFAKIAIKRSPPSSELASTANSAMPATRS